MPAQKIQASMEWTQQNLAVNITEETSAALQYLDQLPYSLSTAIQSSMPPQDVYLQPSSADLDLLNSVVATQDDGYYGTSLWNADSSLADGELFPDPNNSVSQPPDFARTNSGETETKNSVASNASSAGARTSGEHLAAKTQRRSERRKEQNRHAQRLYRERKEQQLRDATECLHTVSQELFEAQATIAKLEAELRTLQEYPREVQEQNESLLNQLNEAGDRNKAFELKWAALRSKLQNHVDDM